MNYIYTTLNWFFGVTTAIMGIVIFNDQPMAGASFITIAMLLLPPVRNFMYTKTGKMLSIKIRSIAIFCLIIAAVFFINTSSVMVEKKEAAIRESIITENSAKEKRKNIEYFETNSTQIIKEIKDAIESENHQEAIRISAKYVSIGNEEIVALNKEASDKMEENKRIERTKNILKSIQEINKTDYERYNNAYKELVKLNPNNSEYASLLKIYSEKLKEISLQNSNPETFVTLEKFSWYTDGFGSIMMANFVIKNSLPWSVKDISIKCTHRAPSGTAIDSNSAKIYEKIEPGKSKSIKNFNMGFIDSQARSSSCAIKDIVVIKN